MIFHWMVCIEFISGFLPPVVHARRYCLNVNAEHPTEGQTHFSITSSIEMEIGGLN